MRKKKEDEDEKFIKDLFEEMTSKTINDDNSDLDDEALKKDQKLKNIFLDRDEIYQ